jgi:hypothetical protein
MPCVRVVMRNRRLHLFSNPGQCRTAGITTLLYRPSGCHVLVEMTVDVLMVQLVDLGSPGLEIPSARYAGPPGDLRTHR